MIKLISALIGVMLANILLGASLAQIKNEFNREILRNGIFKSGCLIIGFLFMLGSATLTEDIVVATINGIDLNLFEGLKTIIIAGIILYSGKDLAKLASLFNIKTNLEIKESDSNE